MDTPTIWRRSLRRLISRMSLWSATQQAEGRLRATSDATARSGSPQPFSSPQCRRSWCSPLTIPRESRSKCLMDCAAVSLRTVLSSGGTSPSCFMAPIGRTRRSRRGCWTSSGYGACRAVLRIFTTASTHFPRPTFTRTSRSSTCPHWSCMVRTTKSCRLIFQERERPSSSREPRNFFTQAGLTVSQPLTRMKSMPTS